MYKEIQPYYRYRFGDNWIKQSKRTIKLDIIQQIIPMGFSGSSLDLTILKISDDEVDNIIVSREEGEEIKKILLGDNKQESVKENKLPEKK